MSRELTVKPVEPWTHSASLSRWLDSVAWVVGCRFNLKKTSVARSSPVRLRCPFQSTTTAVGSACQSAY